MVKPTSIIKVFKNITSIIWCRCSIIFKKLIVKMLITAILYISVTCFRSMHFGTKGNWGIRLWKSHITISTSKALTSDSLPVWSKCDIMYCYQYQSTSVCLSIILNVTWPSYLCIAVCLQHLLYIRLKSLWYIAAFMMSSNGNIFLVTGPSCGEFTGDQWIPLTKACDAELWCFLWSALK